MTKCRLKGTEGPSLHSRCVSGMADNAATALTDSDYLDDVQNALQETYITSLHNRLAERKVNIASSPRSTSSNSSGVESDSTLHPSVRPKTHQKSFKKNKSSKTVGNGIDTAAVTSTYIFGGLQDPIQPSLQDKLQQATRSSVRFFDRAQVTIAPNRF